MGIFSENIIDDGVDSQTNWLNAESILREPLTIISVDVAEANAPQYGAMVTDSMYKRKILKLGEVLRYTFRDDAGYTKTFDSKGMAVYMAFKRANLSPNTRVRITRTGKSAETRYTVTPIEPNEK